MKKISKNINKIKSFSNKESIENLMTIINHGLMINTELPYYKYWKKNMDNYYLNVKKENKLNNIYPYKTILLKISKLANK